MVDPSSLRTVFMGSPEFAVPTLRALHRNGYRVELAVTQPDRPSGRGSRVTPPAVKVAAEELGIGVFQPSTLRDGEVVDRIAAVSPALFVVAAYGKIIPGRVLALPSRGSLNVHASLLPRWRGASPIASAIHAGDPETGVSIMEVVARMDAGPVVAKRAVPIEPSDTAGVLDARLSQLGAELLIESLPAWLSGEIHAVPQDEDAATYCSLLTKQDGHLRASMTPLEAERAVRAFDPWPGAFVELRGRRLGIWSAKVHGGEAPPSNPGAFAVINRQPAVGFCGGWLVLEVVQREGARRISGVDFLNGERPTLPSEVVLA